MAWRKIPDITNRLRVCFIQFNLLLIHSFHIYTFASLYFFRLFVSFLLLFFALLFLLRLFPVSFGYCLCHLFLSLTLIECLSIFLFYFLHNLYTRLFINSLHSRKLLADKKFFNCLHKFSKVEEMFSLNATSVRLFASYTNSLIILKTHVYGWHILHIKSKSFILM